MESPSHNQERQSQSQGRYPPGVSEITVTGPSDVSSTAPPPSYAAPPNYAPPGPTPPTYTDDAVITVKIPIADLEGNGSDDEEQTSGPSSSNTLRPAAQPRRKSWIDKLKPKKNSGVKIVMMTRGDYLRYWARDSKGRYIGTEPEGEGRRVLRRNKQMQGANGTKELAAEAQFSKVTGAPLPHSGAGRSNTPAGMEARLYGEFRESRDPFLGGAKMSVGNGFRPRPGSEFAPVGYFLGGV